MKTLAAVRLVNWYHFQDETFSFAGSCLLLGDNGAGKSTVLDAIQFALVANLQEAKFNKAANEMSDRTLHGYVRHKLGSEDGDGRQRYGRSACTSYIVLEFRDAADPGASFSCGVSMEASEADSDIAKSFFLAPRLRAAEVPALDGEIVRTKKAFGLRLKEEPAARWFPDATTYREELRHRLGLLPDHFHRLIVKALAFRAIHKVRDFVFQYLLDERPIDTVSLQANLENYKKLEAEAREAEKRIASLDEVCAQGAKIDSERRVLESHHFMSARAALEVERSAVSALERRGEELTRLLASLEGRKRDLAQKIASLETQDEGILAKLSGSPTFQQARSFERDLERISQELEIAERAAADARKLLDGQRAALGRLMSSEAEALTRRRPELFPEAILGGDAATFTSRLLADLDRDGLLAARDLSLWGRRLDGATERLRIASIRIDDAQKKVKEESESLRREQEPLEAGRQQYPRAVEALLHLLRTKLKSSTEPRPLCELIEVRNERWRNSLEGYLNTQRFNVIVAADDFPRALSLYDKHKRDYPLPGVGRVFIAGVALVDIEKVRASVPQVRSRSLAEEVVTEDDAVRVYCDYLLGDVICVDSEQDLRRHRKAITDGVMVYSNHAAKQTVPDAYARHFIGEAAKRRRLTEIGKRLGVLSAESVSLGDDRKWLLGAIQLSEAARSGAMQLASFAESASRVPFLKKEVLSLRQKLEQIDRSDIRKLESVRESVRQEKQAKTAEQVTVAGEIGAAGQEKKQIDSSLEEHGIAVGNAVRLLDAVLDSKAAERVQELESKYADERVRRAPDEIAKNFRQQAQIYETRITGFIGKLVQFKQRYVDTYGFNGAIDGDGFADFMEQRELWKDSKLPEYRMRIATAKEEAIQQLTEDIVFRLRELLEGVKRQISELNVALRDVTFGSDRYQFTWEVSTHHRAFYELVMEAGQHSRDSLFGEAALRDSAARAELERLFDQLIEGEAKAVKTALEERADYREYFDYDIRITHADLTTSSYNRVAGDKSGGETQTPYYIAILASMYRLYRTRSTEGKPSCGVVLLDEAFGKMDEGRIRSTLEFARELGLQLVVATPKERSEQVAPFVETSIYIHKDAVSGAPTIFDCTKDFRTHESPAGRGEAGSPPLVARSS